MTARARVLVLLHVRKPSSPDTKAGRCGARVAGLERAGTDVYLFAGGITMSSVLRRFSDPRCGIGMGGAGRGSSWW